MIAMRRMFYAIAPTYHLRWINWNGVRMWNVDRMIWFMRLVAAYRMALRAMLVLDFKCHGWGG